MPGQTTTFRPHDGAPLKVLVAEDDEEMLELCRHVLEKEGYDVAVAHDGTEAIRRIDQGAFDLVLSDIRMSGADGVAVLRRAMSKGLHQPVILMTAFGSVEAAVQAMREGAYYYITKPFDIDDLLEVVGNAAERVRQFRAVQPASGDPEFFPIVHRSAVMRDLMQMAQDVADSNATVLVTGSSGTGKELLARAIHAMSQRADHCFVPVDVNAIPENLIESELFGHKRGSFTDAHADRRGIIEEADAGTLFLDEIGDLSQTVQAKLLRFLQERRLRRIGDVVERTVNVRLISATNRDLRALVTNGAFREDLYYRLSVIPLVIPDLTHRREDIAPLAYHFVRKFNTDHRVEGIRPDALDFLVRYSWPGNVRQLENVMERAVILRKAGLIEPRDLPDEIVEPAIPRMVDLSLEEMEQRYISELLAECGGNQSRVARILGINRRTLYRRLRKPDEGAGT